MLARMLIKTSRTTQSSQIRIPARRAGLKAALCLLSILFFQLNSHADRVVACSGGCGGKLWSRDDGSSFCFMTLGGGAMHAGNGGTVSVPLKVVSKAKGARVSEPNWKIVQIDLPTKGKVTSADLSEAVNEVVKSYNSSQKSAKGFITLQVDISRSVQSRQITKTMRGGETIWISQNTKDTSLPAKGTVQHPRIPNQFQKSPGQNNRNAGQGKQGAAPQ